MWRSLCAVGVCVYVSVCWLTRSSVFRFLLEHGADPYACNNKGQCVFLNAKKETPSPECLSMLQPQKIP